MGHHVRSCLEHIVNSVLVGILLSFLLVQESKSAVGQSQILIHSIGFPTATTLISLVRLF